MERNKIDMFIGMRAGQFGVEHIYAIRSRLERMDDDQFILLQSASFQEPSTMLVIAFFLGIERFWLDDTVLGIIKVITFFGCGIWWLIDLFTAKRRTQSYNFRQFMQLTSYA